MRTRSILSQIQVPEVAAWIDAYAFVRGQQLVVIPDSHAAADNLSYAGHQKICRLRHAGIVARALHVECFDLDGEVGEEDGAVDFVGHSAFGGFGTV